MKVAIVLLTLALSAIKPQEPQTSNASEKIESVLIRGNARIPTNTIKYHMRTKPGDTLNMNDIARDVKELYAQGFFDDIRVDSEAGKEGGIVIVFVVKEKPLIRSIDFAGQLDHQIRHSRETQREQNQHEPGISLRPEQD